MTATTATPATERPAEVIALPSAGVPADHGRSSLGLLMQLAGGVFAVLAGLLATMLFAFMGAGGGNEAAWLLVLLVLSLMRSLAHRRAGLELLYGRRPSGSVPASTPDGVRRYMGVALGQTAAAALILRAALGVPGAAVLGTGIGLLAWPLVLAVVLGPRLGGRSGSGHGARPAAPCAEDRGFEGASILMVVLGACGLIASAVAMIAAALARRDLDGAGFLVVLGLAALALRSAIHIRAGLTGLRAEPAGPAARGGGAQAPTPVDRSIEWVTRYANVAVISAFAASGAWLLGEPSLPGIAIIAAASWLLLLWPLGIRRFFWDRQFTDLLAGERAHLHRRAPDAGLTALGWLLAGHAALTAALLAPLLLTGAPMTDDLDRILALAAGRGSGPVWWTLGVLALEVWAARELVRMGPLHRLAATAYGAAAILATLSMTGPLLQHVTRAGALAGEPWSAILLVEIGCRLVIPAAAVLLAGRRLAPAARARYRGRQDARKPGR